MKLLEVLHEIQPEVDIDIVSTYLGAHSVPKGSNAEGIWFSHTIFYCNIDFVLTCFCLDTTKDIITNHIPKIKSLIESSAISPTLIDVFCEKGVFSIDQTRQILSAGKEIGIIIISCQNYFFSDNSI